MLTIRTFYAGRVLAWLSLLVVGAAPLLAQGTDASIQGIVRDSAGSVLADADVEARHLGTGFAASVRTDARGRFTLLQLPLGGPWRLTARRIGFHPAVRELAPLRLGGAVDVTIALTPSVVQLEALEVVGDTALERRAARLGGSTRIDEEVIARVPAVNRSYTDLAALAPTVGPQLAVGGGRFTATDFRIDGAQSRNMLRAGEAEQVERDYVAATGVRLKVVEAADRFVRALAGVIDPEDKRKLIGREFIRVFETAAREVVEEAGETGATVEFLVQGTLYPDVVESGGGTGAANIKSHHNVGGLPDDLQFALVEPLRDLFKDEVRRVGEQLGLPPEIVWRQPFPGPGLGIRIVGEVTAERLAVLRRADAIVRAELSSAGLDRDIWQCPVVLLATVRSVGVQGDGRTYGHPVVLRPVSSEDAMTADWTRLPYDVLERISTRITNEVREINRVVLDLTSKPPGTIEWE